MTWPLSASPSALTALSPLLTAQCLESAVLAVGAFALPAPAPIYLQVSQFKLITFSAAPPFLPYQPLLFSS